MATDETNVLNVTQVHLLPALCIQSLTRVCGAKDRSIIISLQTFSPANTHQLSYVSASFAAFWNLQSFEMLSRYFNFKEGASLKNLKYHNLAVAQAIPKHTVVQYKCSDIYAMAQAQAVPKHINQTSKGLLETPFPRLCDVHHTNVHHP